MDSSTSISSSLSHHRGPQGTTTATLVLSFPYNSSYFPNTHR